MCSLSRPSAAEATPGLNLFRRFVNDFFATWFAAIDRRGCGNDFCYFFGEFFPDTVDAAGQQRCSVRVFRRLVSPRLDELHQFLQSEQCFHELKIPFGEQGWITEVVPGQRA